MVVIALAASVVVGCDRTGHHDSGSVAPAMSHAVRWRMDGVRAGDESGRWSARARTARLVASKVGPFRFMPLRVLEVEGLELRVTDTGGGAAGGLRDGLLSLPDALAKEQASRVSVTDFHLDIRDGHGGLLCCMIAGSATWSVGKLDASMSGAVLVRHSDGISRSGTASLDEAGVLSSPAWQPWQDDRAHDEAIVGHCPLLARAR